MTHCKVCTTTIFFTFILRYPIASFPTRDIFVATLSTFWWDFNVVPHRIKTNDSKTWHGSVTTFCRKQCGVPQDKNGKGQNKDLDIQRRLGPVLNFFTFVLWGTTAFSTKSSNKLTSYFVLFRFCPVGYYLEKVVSVATKIPHVEKDAMRCHRIKVKKIIEVETLQYVICGSKYIKSSENNCRTTTGRKEGWNDSKIGNTKGEKTANRNIVYTTKRW